LVAASAAGGAPLDEAGESPQASGEAAEAPEAPAGVQAPLFENDPLFDDDGEDLAGFPAPIESWNRGTFRINREFHRLVGGPVSRTYRLVTPDMLRVGIRRALDNASMPPVVVNDLFQLEWKDAATATGRLLVNTTFGLGGLFDPATGIGLEAHRSDFGQTLTLAGVGSGPYLIVPFVGPTCLRDGFGQIVDAFLRPAVYFLGPTLLIFYGGTESLSALEEHSDELEALEQSSVDFYATMRSAYYQKRTGDIWSRREHRRRRAGEATEAP